MVGSLTKGTSRSSDEEDRSLCRDGMSRSVWTAVEKISLQYLTDLFQKIEKKIQWHSIFRDGMWPLSTQHYPTRLKPSFCCNLTVLLTTLTTVILSSGRCLYCVTCRPAANGGQLVVTYTVMSMIISSSHLLFLLSYDWPISTGGGGQSNYFLGLCVDMLKMVRYIQS